MATKQDFDQAVVRLLGEEKYTALRNSGYSRPQFCREVAQDAFIGCVLERPSQQADLELVQEVAARLWRGDGVTGLDD